MGITTFDPAASVLIAKKQGKRSVSASLLAFSAAFCVLFLSFYLFLTSNCLQVSLFTILLEGVLSYNPRFEKARS